ncbi:MAG TPA: hypothetical protein VGG19_13085 [Tepidisphaeraceae bacterium]|jgi:hypothetical protein
MPQIQLADQIYKEAQRRAAEGGFSSVDDYVADVISQSIHQPAENYDHLFTPERIAHLDRISAAIKAGAKTYSTAEVQAHFEQKRKQWLDNHAS